jgi:hypothetical protein
LRKSVATICKSLKNVDQITTELSMLCPTLVAELTLRRLVAV